MITKVTGTIIFDIKYRVRAVGIRNYGPFIQSSQKIMSAISMVDSGLKEGKLYTKASYSALVHGFNKQSATNELFDPRQFSLAIIAKGRYPQWAIDSALSFVGLCVEHKLSIEIPLWS